MNRNKYTAASVGEKVDAFLRSVYKLGGFELTHEISDRTAPADDDFETPDVMVQFSGPDVDILLANKAELLLALEHLTMEMLRVPGEEHSLICFDANDYRVLRIEELRLSALTAAERVKQTRVPFQFSPMTSRERRIVHLALRNEPAVRSESSGMGSHRQVVIYPADMPSKPQLGGPPPKRGGPPPRGRSRRR